MNTLINTYKHSQTLHYTTLHNTTLHYTAVIDYLLRYGLERYQLIILIKLDNDFCIRQPLSLPHI